MRLQAMLWVNWRLVAGSVFRTGHAFDKLHTLEAETPCFSRAEVSPSYSSCTQPTYSLVLS